MEENQQPVYPTTRKAIGSAKHFHSLCEKRFRQRRFRNNVQKMFKIVPLAMQNFHVLRDCRLEIFGIVGLVLMESIWIVYMLIFNVNFNIVTIECKMLFTCVTRGAGGSSSSSVAAAVSTSALASSLCFLLSFSILCYCNLRNCDGRQISVSKPNTSVWNQHSGNNPFEIQSLWNFHRQQVKL